MNDLIDSSGCSVRGDLTYDMNNHIGPPLEECMNV